MLIIPKILFRYTTKSGGSKHLTAPLKQRIGRKLASTKFKNAFLRGVLKVVYGKAKCASGCVCVFDNEIRGNIEDIKWALEAFMDKDLWVEKPN